MKLILPRAFSDRRGGILVAGMLAVAGAVFVWQALTLDLGNAGLPGPGFFPLALGAILLIFSIIIAVGHWRSSEGGTVELGHRDMLIALVALLAVPLLFEPLGAYITLGLFGTTMLVLLARIPLPTAILAASVGMAACWYFFQVLLGLQLPMGPL